MALSLSIVPLADSIDLYGEPDASSAYSLSGHVSVSFSPSSSLFSRRRHIRLLLQSLSITFEGQSELLSPETGYSGLRLCSISQELAPSQSLELSNEGMEDAQNACIWNFVFNLTLPGWLPSTSVFSDSQHGAAGTKYALYATAKVANTDGSAWSSSSWLPSSFCSPFNSSIKSIQARPCPITVNRLHIPPALPASEASDFPMLSFSISAMEKGNGAQRANGIPIEILSKLQMIISLPERIDASREMIPFSLRLRAPDLSDEEISNLQLTQFTLDVQQTEKYQTQPSSSYLFPLPSSDNQPPNRSLLDPHPCSIFYGISGLMAGADECNTYTRTYSVSPDGLSTEFCPSNEGKIFRRGPSEPERSAWYAMHVALPFVNADEHEDEVSIRKGTSDTWAGARRLRSTQVSPLFEVKHELEVSIELKYATGEGEGEEVLDERLTFGLPLKFVHLRSSSLSPAFTLGNSPLDTTTFVRHHPADSTDSLASVSESAPLMPVSRPYTTFSLPSYNELYHSNGQRRVDETTPLPVYTKSPSPEPRSSTSSLMAPTPACPFVTIGEVKRPTSDN